MRLANVVAALTGLAFLTSGAIAKEPVTVEIGYMPILPVSQLFVALESGELAKAGIKPKLVRFQNGPAMVQAILAGQLDVAHFGIGPAMVAQAKGADIKVVASSIVEQISFVALPNLAKHFQAGDPAGAFARFAKANDRKAVIATFPVGSVPETVLQYWLRKQLKIDPSQIEIVYQGAAVVQQSLMSGAVDGAAILEPAVTIVTSKKEGALVVAKGSQMFPRQPGAVLAVRERFISKHPDLVQAMVAAHALATQLLRKDSAKAANAVAKYVGGGRLPVAIVKKAIEGSQESFVADPDFIVSGTRAMRDFQASVGTLKAKVDLDALFEPRFFRALNKAAK